MIGGLQDNSTIWQDGTDGPGRLEDAVSVRRRHVGVGLPSDATRRSCSRASRATTSSRTSATATSRPGCGPTDPIAAADERETVTASTGRQFITFDQVRPGHAVHGVSARVADRRQRRRPGVSRSELQVLRAARPASFCGDWVPLGVPYPFRAGSTADSASRKPGDLTSDLLRRRSHRRPHRGRRAHARGRRHAVGGHELRAGCSSSKNVDGPAAAVAFARVDTPVTPNRFVTRIVVDRADPEHRPTSRIRASTRSRRPRPGHVFRVVYDP